MVLVVQKGATGKDAPRRHIWQQLLPPATYLNGTLGAQGELVEGSFATGHLAAWSRLREDMGNDPSRDGGAPDLTGGTDCALLDAMVQRSAVREIGRSRHGLLYADDGEAWPTKTPLSMVRGRGSPSAVAPG